MTKGTWVPFESKDSLDKWINEEKSVKTAPVFLGSHSNSQNFSTVASGIVVLPSQCQGVPLKCSFEAI